MRIILPSLDLHSGYGELLEGRNDKLLVSAHDAYITVDGWGIWLEASRGAVSVVAGILFLDGIRRPC